jgi:hypothetical protein
VHPKANRSSPVREHAFHALLEDGPLLWSPKIVAHEKLSDDTPEESKRKCQDTENQAIQLREYCQRQGFEIVHECVDQASVKPVIVMLSNSYLLRLDANLTLCWYGRWIDSPLMLDRVTEGCPCATSIMPARGEPNDIFSADSRDARI